MEYESPPQASPGPQHGLSEPPPRRGPGSSYYVGPETAAEPARLPSRAAPSTVPSGQPRTLRPSLYNHNYDDEEDAMSNGDSGFGQVSEGDEIDVELPTLMEQMVDSHTLGFFSAYLEAAYANYAQKIGASTTSPFLLMLPLWALLALADFVVQDFDFAPDSGAAWGDKQTLLYVVLGLRVLGFVVIGVAWYITHSLCERVVAARKAQTAANAAASAAAAASANAARADDGAHVPMGSVVLEVNHDGVVLSDGAELVADTNRTAAATAAQDEDLPTAELPEAVERMLPDGAESPLAAGRGNVRSPGDFDDDYAVDGDDDVNGGRGGDGGGGPTDSGDAGGAGAAVDDRTAFCSTPEQWHTVRAAMPYTFYSHLTSFMPAAEVVRSAALLLLVLIHILCAFLLWMTLNPLYLTPLLAVMLWGHSDVQRKWVVASVLNIFSFLVWVVFALLEAGEVSAFPLVALPLVGRYTLSTYASWAIVAAVMLCALALRARAGYNLELFDRQSFLLNTQIKTYERNMNMVLLRMLPKPIVDRMKSTAMQQAWERFPSVTIMFTSICDFDKIASRIEAPHLVMLLNAIFLDLDAKLAEFKAYGVYKVETIGEVYLVSCGCPFEQVLHADVMCDLALRALASIRQLFPQLRMKMGLHSGAVVAGVIGVHYPRYRIIGDTINTSSRMGSTCKPDTIQLSSDTARLVMTPDNEIEAGQDIRSDPVGTALHPSESICYALADLGTMPVKGKGEMRTWRLEGRRKGVDARYTFSPSAGAAEEVIEDDDGFQYLATGSGLSRGIGRGGGRGGGGLGGLGGGGGAGGAGGGVGGAGADVEYFGEMDQQVLDMHLAAAAGHAPLPPFAAAHMGEGGDEGAVMMEGFEGDEAMMMMMMMQEQGIDGEAPLEFGGPERQQQLYQQQQQQSGGPPLPIIHDDDEVAPIRVGRDFYGPTPVDEAVETETVNPYTAAYDEPIRTPRYSEYY